MKKLAVYTDFVNTTEILSDAEIGRLFRAMLRYASSGSEPNLSGNERFLWGTAKADIDRQRESYETICHINRANASHRSAPNRSESQQSAPNRSESQQEKKRKEKKGNEKNISPTEPETAFEIALEEFRQYRKESKHPLNELAEKKLLKELDRLSGGDEAKKILILDQSIRNDWRGVFALKEKNTRQTYAQHPATNLDHLLVNLDD